jgi:hypothetical protein
MRHARNTHARNTLAGAAIAVMTALVITSCDAGSDPARDAKNSPTSASTPKSMAGVDGPLEAGPWVVPMWGEKSDSLPRAVVEVPPGYGSPGGWVVDRGADGDPDSYGSVSFWSVQGVLRDACEGVTAFDPGPGVRDLARALRAQTGLESTVPKPVTVDGRSGLYLEVGFPKDQSRINGCHESSYHLWQTDLGDYYGGNIAGTVSRVWILDVNGTRVVMVADTTPHEDAVAAAEVLGIAASTHFVEPLKPRAARLLTYAQGRTIHWGERSIDAGRDILSLHVTDDGVAFTGTDGSIWFTDGSGVDQIGTLGDGSLSDAPYGFDKRATISSGNTGSLVAWVSATNGRQGLVVYDTAARKEVLRTPATEPTAAVGGHHQQWPEQILAVLDDTVYAACAGRGDLCFVSEAEPRLARYDLATGERTLVKEADYQADLRSSARQLVVGGSYASGLVLEGPGVDFRRLGSGLVALKDRTFTPGRPASPFNPVLRGRPTSSFVTGRANRLQLHLPSGQANAENLHVFQWLDDDTLALWAGARSGHKDLLTCTLSTGRCTKVVDGSAVDRVPGLPGQDA